MSTLPPGSADRKPRDQDPLIENRESKIENPQGVSVVIPAYNYARFLETAVRSALAQRHPALEVIIIDDGSTDSTPELCHRLQGEFPALRYIRQENAGLSAARNAGIRNANHPFVAFLDADDEWLPEMLDTIMAEFSRQPASVPLVACNSLRVDPAGAPVGEKITAPRGDRYFTAADILMKTRFMPSCAVVRRGCFAACREFDTTLRSSEDRDLWIRLAALGPVRYVDRALVRIRKHDANMSRNSDRMRANMRVVRRKAFRNRVVPRTRAGFWLRVLAMDHFQGAWMYWDDGRALRALLYAVSSLALWPLPLDHRDLHEPPFFRIRAAARFLLLGPFRKRHG